MLIPSLSPKAKRLQGIAPSMVPRFQASSSSIPCKPLGRSVTWQEVCSLRAAANFPWGEGWLVCSYQCWDAIISIFLLTGPLWGHGLFALEGGRYFPLSCFSFHQTVFSLGGPVSRRSGRWLAALRLSQGQRNSGWGAKTSSWGAEECIFLVCNIPRSAEQEFVFPLAPTMASLGTRAWAGR